MSNILNSITYIPCNTKNHGGTRSAAAIRYLVYHYTANDGDHDTNNAVYYRDNVVKASAHYFVDDDSITQSVQDTVVAWAVGGNKWSDCAQTGGGKMRGIVTNSNSISIEMCDTVRDGTYNVTEATLKNAIALGRALMERYQIPIERVVRHFDVTGKHCPAYFMDEGKWAAFKARLVETEKKKDELDMTKADFLRSLTNDEAYEILLKANEYAAELATPDWMKDELQEAIDAGITDGTRPLAAVQRGAAAIMAKRAAAKK